MRMRLNWRIVILRARKKSSHGFRAFVRGVCAFGGGACAPVGLIMPRTIAACRT
jgi:hypothetical protein